VNKLIFSFCLIFIDLCSKYFVKNNFLLNKPVKINNFLDFVYVQNHGVSFGLLSGMLSYWLLVIIGLVIVFIILVLMVTCERKLEKFAYFIIIIGAISNIIDRSLNSYVIDFISIHYENYFWPAFNFADIYITIGIIMLVMTLFTKPEKNK
tara:strand:- start:625 stop:1077 length:453 start_codon:yes stop_codon:yes gene_type:complete